MTFTDAEWRAIAHALRVAAKRYADHIILVRDLPEHTRLVFTFERQIAQALDIAKRIDEWRLNPG